MAASVGIRAMQKGDILLHHVFSCVWIKLSIVWHFKVSDLWLLSAVKNE